VLQNVPCAAKTRKGEICKNPSAKGNRFCWLHRLSRTKDAPWYLNSNWQALAGILATVIVGFWFFSLGPTVAKQDEGLALSRNKIDKIVVDVVFEFPKTNTNYPDFWNELTNFVASGILEHRRAAADKFRHLERSPTRPFSPKFRSDSSQEDEYINQIPGPIIEKTLGKPPELARMRIGFNRVRKSSSSLREMLVEQNGRPDLVLDCITNALPGLVSYDAKSEKVLVEWKGLKLPLTPDSSNSQIFSVRDLGESQMFFTVSDRKNDASPDHLLWELRPIWFNLQVDGRQVVLTNFQTLRRGDEVYVVHETTLPTSEAILNGSTYTPNPYH
jgi:hypothetical protein